MHGIDVEQRMKPKSNVTSFRNRDAKYADVREEVVTFIDQLPH